jgi:hypothetical protein
VELFLSKQRLKDTLFPGHQLGLVHQLCFPVWHKKILFFIPEVTFSTWLNSVIQLLEIFLVISTF